MARILVCEDSPTQAYNLKTILESAGHEVVLAENGQLGLQQLQSSAFDLVLSDVQMPHLGGFDMCRLIRQQPHLVNLPIILLTTLKEMQDMRRGHDVGANMYVVKPYEAGDLLRRLNRFLGGIGPGAPQPVTAAPTSAAPAAASTPGAAPRVGVVALRELLSRILNLTEEGLQSALGTDDVSGRNVLEGIKQAAGEALMLCGGTVGRPASVSLVLVVPGDSLRQVLATNLEKGGYHVRPQATAEAALMECRALGPAVRFIVSEKAAWTQELAAGVQASCPQARAVLMVEPNDSPPDGMAAIQRPFTVNSLLLKLKEVQAG